MVMANHNGRATSSIPSWLRPINRKSSPSHHSPARIAGSTRGSTPLTNLNPTQPQHRPSAPQRNSEPPPTTHRVMSTSYSAPASFQPHTSTVKGKATAGTLGDEGQQDLPHAVVNLQCGGGAGECGEGFRWISEMEGAKIREEAETALKKNLARRVTPSESTRNGVIQSKRARTAAACDDGESSIFLFLRIQCSLLLGARHRIWPFVETENKERAAAGYAPRAASGYKPIEL
jgi:hypothetical protein